MRHKNSETLRNS